MPQAGRLLRQQAGRTSFRPCALSCSTKLSSASGAVVKLLLMSKNVGSDPAVIAAMRWTVVVGASATNRKARAAPGYEARAAAARVARCAPCAQSGHAPHRRERAPAAKRLTLLAIRDCRCGMRPWWHSAPLAEHAWAYRPSLTTKS